MKLLLAVGMVIVLIAGNLALFGTVYSSRILTGRNIDCGRGCSQMTEQDVVVTYYLYPIWSPPAWTVNYTAASCTAQSWYTPLNPPPSCLLAPALAYTQSNYTLNLIGVVLTGLGIVMVAWVSIQHRPKVESPNQPPST